ncbi:helix-turn-helix domain-containing protein [Cupriavidus sp. IDO]|uniref:helix-turn-helix domain-containing protein n=1 Tax=Cupriavidus sp. IDO TaxID=1539142 RepID=UPI00068AFEED|nr:helix-turn-helix domain-containing protein [Cupriavidus sp. IDO]KWR88798.1 hypothetical protein RM96_17955 [Cupriavidus sp. IDO]
MSVEAITWALRQKVGRSSTKHVLTLMANCAAEPALRCYTSIAYLVEATELDRKTVIAAIQKLEEMGLITDDGERTGRTGQIVVYQMNVGQSAEEAEGGEKRNSSKNGTVPKTAAKGTKNGLKQSQKRTERYPKTGHGTEGTEEEQKGTGKGAHEKPEKAPKPFEAFWTLYPRKASKGDAEKAYLKLAPDAALQAVLLDAVAKQTGWDSWKEEGGKFIPYPATWLRDQRWTDEPPKQSTPAAGASGAATDTTWWETAPGIEAKGAEVWRARKQGEDFQRYKVGVFKHAGEGPWRQALLADLLRTKSSIYADVHQYFYGHPPVEAS